jgi:hypothetical protein
VPLCQSHLQNYISFYSSKDFKLVSLVEKGVLGWISILFRMDLVEKGVEIVDLHPESRKGLLQFIVSLF